MRVTGYPSEPLTVGLPVIEDILPVFAMPRVGKEFRVGARSRGRYLALADRY